MSTCALLLALANLGAGETVLLDFYSNSCRPCLQMMPMVDGLAKQGHPIRKVNTGNDPQGLTARFQVRLLPTFVMLVDGREVDRQVGATGRERLLQMLSKAPPGGAAKRTRTPGRMPAVQASAPLDGRNGFRQGAMQQVRDRAMAASVRLKVDDPDGHSYGSGTVIDLRGDEALILTCGHIFRDSQGRGQTTVDFFCPGGEQGVPARLVGYDLNRDVALVRCRVNFDVVPARVAPPDCQVRPGDAVVTVGCNNGADPTPQLTHVNSLNKIVGPPNLQVAGVPVEGRSGGGLFASDGRVIGVCNAADPEYNEGLFAALGSIYAELDRHGLTQVYHDTGSGKLPGLDARLAGAAPPRMPDRMPALQPRRGPAIRPPAISSQERAALSALDLRGAEVVTVIRARDANGQQREIVLQNASPEFLRQLAENQGQLQQRLTSQKERAGAGIASPRPTPQRAPWAETPDDPRRTADTWQPQWRRNRR